MIVNLEEGGDTWRKLVVIEGEELAVLVPTWWCFQGVGGARDLVVRQ
jgi:hypothetical protein